VLDNSFGPYLAVTIRNDPYGMGTGDAQLLRIDDDATPSTFVYIDADVGILTGICALPDGPYEEYYDNGQLRIRASRTNGVQSGPWVSFHRNGQLGRRGTLNADGNWIGAYEEFDENGESIAKGRYESDAAGTPRPCGVWHVRLGRAGIDPLGGAQRLRMAVAVDTTGSAVTYAPCRG
jgi:hypothetical protein